ncbi:MAG: sugar phosphate isomerase/epimerase [Syntrophobacteraceae bacterium]|nr:sugar phosphate isomerase/epimerase [Syntrophobacteraceae bacterium]
MKLAFSSNAFRRYTLSESMRIISQAGFQGMEIMADTPHAFPRHLTEENLLEIRLGLAESHLEISNVNAFMLHAVGDTYHPSWIEEDPALRRIRIDYTLDCIDLAKKLGARTVSTEPGGPLNAMTREQGLSLFREGLEIVGPRARQEGIRVLIEPEPGLLIETSREFREFFEELDPEVFGLNFDIGHFFCVGEDPAALITEFRDCIHHFHLEDIAETREHHHLMPGKGVIDFQRVFDGMAAIGYSGFVTVELYTYEDRAEEATREAFDYLRRLLS